MVSSGRRGSVACSVVVCYVDRVLAWRVAYLRLVNGCTGARLSRAVPNSVSNSVSVERLVRKRNFLVSHAASQPPPFPPLFT